jgi:hypothetical protein
MKANKVVVVLIVLVVFATNGVFALQQSNTNTNLGPLTDTLSAIVGLIGGDLVRYILVIALAGLLVAGIFNRQNSDMLKSIVTFAVIGGALLGVNAIVSAVFGQGAVATEILPAATSLVQHFTF